MLKPLLPVIILLGALGAGGCKQQPKDPYPAATRLLAEARQAYDAGDFEAALTLLDSLDGSQREAVALRREGMNLRARAIEGATATRLPQVAQEIAATEQTIQALSPQMTALPGTEFDVPRNWPGRGDILTQGVEPRVQRPEGYFRLAVKCRPIGFNSVRLSAGGQSVSTKPLPRDRVAVSEGTELASLGQEEYAPLAAWLAEHRGQPVTLTLDGSRGKWSTKLTAAQVDALDQSWALSAAIMKMFELRKEQDRLTATLDIARRQAGKQP